MADETQTPAAEKPNDAPAASVPAPATTAVAATPPAKSDPPATTTTTTATSADGKPAADPPPAVDPAKPATDPTATKPAPDPAPAKPAADPDAVPEGDYEIKLEGDLKDRALDPNAIKAITPVLKELGLSTAKASKLAAAFVQYQLGAPAAKNQADLATLRADPQFGLANFGQTQQHINDALQTFTTQAERETLVKIGMANDPALVRMFARIGAALAGAPQDDTGRPAPQPKSTASKLYGGRDKVAGGKA